MFVIVFVNAGIVFFYVSVIFVGLGLHFARRVMLNEARATERAAAQGVLALNTSVGQLVGGALVGAVAASFGGGTSGYTTAFLAVGVTMVAMVLLTLGLKGRATEQQTAKQNQVAAE